MSRAVSAREGTQVGPVSVTQDAALRHSAVWAALVLRADLISSMPVDTYRTVQGVSVEVPRPPVLVAPASGWTIREWLWATQFDLDRMGNAIGIIVARDGLGLPAQIELVPAGSVSVLGRRDQITGYRYDGQVFTPGEVWHERQYRLPGCPLGLSPIAYAAYAIGGYLSAQEFAMKWFTSGATPSVVFRNTEKTLTQEQATEAKRKVMAASSQREPIVFGRGWEFSLADFAKNDASFLAEMQWGVVEVARYLRVPADVIDGAVSGQSVTYANIGQRNLQLMIMNLGPAKNRRDDALSGLLARPRYVRLNQDAAVLQMDPQTRASVLGQMVRDRLMTPTEAREKLDRQPLTEADCAEFDRLWGVPGGADQLMEGAPA